MCLTILQESKFCLTSESLASLASLELVLVCGSHDGDFSRPGDAGADVVDVFTSLLQWLWSVGSAAGTGVDVRSGDVVWLSFCAGVIELFIELSNVVFSELFIVSDWFWISNDVDAVAELFGLESIRYNFKDCFSQWKKAFQCQFMWNFV